MPSVLSFSRPFKYNSNLHEENRILERHAPGSVERHDDCSGHDRKFPPVALGMVRLHFTTVFFCVSANITALHFQVDVSGLVTGFICMYGAFSLAFGGSVFLDRTPRGTTA